MRKHILLLLVGLLASTGAYSAPDKVAYELQERCGNATKAEFNKSWGETGVVSLKTSTMVANYSNHYNTKLNKCYYLLSTSVSDNSPNSISIDTKALFDFNENISLGEYRVRGNKSHCEFKGVECKSKEAFDALIKPYMEE